MITQIIITIVALAGGFAGGYFLFRLRFKKELGLYEAREKALKYREAELERVRPSLPEHDSEKIRLRATVDLLREELEQKEMEMGITREEHDLELHLLQKEIESARNGDRGPSRLEIEIEDAAYHSTEARDHGEPTMEPASTSDEADPSSSIEPQDEPPDATEPETPTSDDSDESDPAEWATSLVQNWISSLVSSLSPTPEEASVQPVSDDEQVGDDEESHESEKAADSVSATSTDIAVDLPAPVSATTSDVSGKKASDPRRLSYPSYRSIIEYMVAPERGPVSGRLDNFGTGSTVEKAGLQLLLGLQDEDFRRLSEMGYSTYEDIAQLTSPQIHELSHRFEIPESRIVNVWISGAHLRLYEGSR